MAENDPELVKEWRELYIYVRSLGDQVLRLHNRLETIEKNVEEITAIHRTFFGENKVVLQHIREHMLHKREFGNFVEHLNNSMGGTKPPLPILAKEALEAPKPPEQTKAQLPSAPGPLEEPPTEEPAPQRSLQDDKEPPTEEKRKEPKKHRFAFWRR
ncbi:MAG: hypothetical protein V1915_05005 [Candidatus Bathyarchaeota archaeon]